MDHHDSEGATTGRHRSPTFVDGPTTIPTTAAIGARYELGEIIGRGGMGDVMSAHDNEIGRRVAIKRLRTETPSPDATARFIREARIQGQLDHPAVVPVHELRRDDDGQPYFVMKQLVGVTLADVLVRLAHHDAATAAAFPRQRLLRAFAEVCLAIEFAHTRGILHRDLKPANVMLGDFGEVYVLDWGIARVAGDADLAPDPDSSTRGAGITEVGAIMGTPGYMSPEQVRGELDLDVRSDVYSLGCILFELLALASLHPRGTEALKATLLEVDGRPSVAAADRDVPPELDAICRTATRLDRNERQPSARALAEAVHRFLDGDRDLGARKRLAMAEIASAMRALASDDSAGRREAMRAAARALALDPTDPGPANLVARLMLEPPADPPPEVDRALAERDLDVLYSARRLTVGAAIGGLAMLPALWSIGFRELPALGVLVALIIGAGVPVWFATRRLAVVIGRTSLVCWTLMVAWISHLTSPFLIAPCLAIIVAMAFASHPRLLRPWILAILQIAAVLGPWLAVPDAVTIRGSDVILRSGTQLDPLAGKVCMVVYVVSSIVTAVIAARMLTEHRRVAQRRVEIQAWQLRQLVPDPPVSR